MAGVRRTSKSNEPTVIAARVRTWPPSCVSGLCEFVGEPGPESSPYLACGGDPDRHNRPPVR